MDIRPAEPADLDAVIACVRAAYTPYVERLGKLPAPLQTDHAHLITDGKVHVAVRDRVTGVIVFYPRGDHVHVETVAVVPEARGKGLGRLLLRHAEKTATTLGLEAIELYTNVLMIENISYYRSLGFAEIHRGEEDGFHRVYFRKAVSPLEPYRTFPK